MPVRGADTYIYYFVISYCVVFFPVVLGRHHSRDVGPLYINHVPCLCRSNFVLFRSLPTNIGQTLYSTLSSNHCKAQPLHFFESTNLETERHEWDNKAQKTEHQTS